MRFIKEYRLRAAMCRAQAQKDVRNSRTWLAEAASWTSKAEEEIASRFKECSAISLVSAKENSVGGAAILSPGCVNEPRQTMGYQVDAE
jgi:hypothetical protein